ncbi:MAG: ABC transporter permease, partial [Gammaproteobacteria bacterium]|nr:ABC transporter permease [Gammaproteobacteria bacterium]
MKIVIHSFRFFRRELFQPEMRLVFLALLLTVTAMATVGLLTDRIGKALQRQSNELLGADMVVASSRAIPDSWQAYARNTGLSTAYFKEFPSVLITQDDSALTEVKAVTADYPLRGELVVRDSENQIRINEIPDPGSLWVENNLLRKLGLTIGDRVTLGKSTFTLAAVVEQEPDRGGNLFALAPRVLMNQIDLAATELVGEGSRVQHRLMLAGETRILNSYQRWLEERLGQHYRIQSVRDSRPEVNASLERAERFLALSLVVTIVLASLATWVAMQTWVQKRLVHAAVLRTIGLTRLQILGIYLSQLLFLVILACASAMLLAWLLQNMFVGVMQSYMAAALPAANIKPAVIACVLGLSLVMAFSLPVYWRLVSASPMLVLRSMPEKLDSANWSLVLGMLVLIAVLGWLTADMTLLMITVLGLTGAILILVILSHVLLTILKPLGKQLPTGYRLGIHALLRHRRETMMSISVFGLSFIFVILLTLIRTDLLDQWRDRLPMDTPNIFLINIQPNELPAIQQWLQNQGLQNVAFSPMVRARLTKINAHEVSGDDYQSPRAQRLVKREFNLSWSDELPSHNQLSSGQWWGRGDDGAMPQWSVESGIAQTLGIKMGDELSFDAPGQIIRGQVTSLREVSWDSFKVNFFVIGTTPMLSSVPSRYISSFYLPSEQRGLMNQLVKHYPSVTVLDVDALMKRVRNVIDKVSYAAEAAFVFTLIAAILLIVAMVMSGRHLRQQETALLRTMGATTPTLGRALRTEFLLIGASSGLIAVLLSNLLA